MRENRINSLDGLRGVAAVSVVLMHIYYIWGMNFKYPQFGIYIEHFGFAVHLFYMLSGFTLSYTYFNNPDNRSFKFFIIKRFFRIAPLFYICIVLNFAVIKYFKFNVDIYNAVSIFTNLFLLFNLYPSSVIAESLTPAGWTIGVEWIFYIIFPIMVLCIKKRYLIFIILLFSLIYPIFESSIINSLGNVENTYFLNYFFLNFFPFFILGMILYKFYGFIKRAVSIEIKFILYAIIFLLSYAIFTKKITVYINLAWGLNFSLIVICAIANNSNILSSRPFLFLGKISFSVYLLHGILMGIMGAYIQNYMILFKNINLLGYENYLFLSYFIIYFLILLLVSILSFYIIEAPFNRLSVKLIQSMNSV